MDLPWQRALWELTFQVCFWMFSAMITYAYLKLVVVQAGKHWRGVDWEPNEKRDLILHSLTVPPVWLYHILMIMWKWLYHEIDCHAKNMFMEIGYDVKDWHNLPLEYRLGIYWYLFKLTCKEMYSGLHDMFYESSRERIMTATESVLEALDQHMRNVVNPLAPLPGAYSTAKEIAMSLVNETNCITIMSKTTNTCVRDACECALYYFNLNKGPVDLRTREQVELAARMAQVALHNPIMQSTKIHAIIRDVWTYQDDRKYLEYRLHKRLKNDDIAKQMMRKMVDRFHIT